MFLKILILGFALYLIFQLFKHQFVLKNPMSPLQKRIAFGVGIALMVMSVGVGLGWTTL